MEPRISLVTLGVSDLARAKAFYEALGWEGQEVQDTVFVQAGGLALILWGRAALTDDGGLADAHPDDGYGGIDLAHNVRSRDEVDAVVAEAVAAGATVTKPAAETFYGGYAAWFTDPDGHVWEIAHNPGFTLADDGSLVLPDFGATADPPRPTA
jgi:catechol 2,3-dioxygenase-like lactoylglutathione lyase family enzyme